MRGEETKWKRKAVLLFCVWSFSSTPTHLTNLSLPVSLHLLLSPVCHGGMCAEGWQRYKEPGACCSLSAPHIGKASKYCTCYRKATAHFPPFSSNSTSSLTALMSHPYPPFSAQYSITYVRNACSFIMSRFSGHSARLVHQCVCLRDSLTSARCSDLLEAVILRWMVRPL